MNMVEMTGLIASIGSLIGAFVLWKKSRPEVHKLHAEEAKIRIEAFNVQVDAIRDTYSRMLEDQIKSVVEPMERRIDRLNKLVGELQDEVDELKSYRNRFDVAVLYIRALCHWIDSIGVVASSDKPKPKLPDELKEYFEMRDKK